MEVAESPAQCYRRRMNKLKEILDTTLPNQTIGHDDTVRFMKSGRIIDSKICTELLKYTIEFIVTSGSLTLDGRRIN